MRIGVLCEFSGTVRDAFRSAGHEAVSCDLLPAETGGPHIQGDALAQDWSGFDLLICHPPCTYLCNSGVRWLHEREGRWESMEAACRFFNALADLPSPRIALENPIPHGYALERIGRYDQIIQPWQFGHGETKKTCLWLKGLLHLSPSDVVAGRAPRVHHASPGPEALAGAVALLSGHRAGDG